MKSLLLIRHGETEWNLKSMTQGCYNTNLTEQGIKQGLKLCKRLKNMKRDFIKIYTSDLDRCSFIATKIGRELNIDIEVNPYLREMNFGQWEGLTNKEIENGFLEIYTKWRKEPHRTIIPDGEKLIDVQQRCLKAIENILDSFESGTVIIVSHSISIKTIILGLLEIELEKFYKLSINNVSISEIEFRNYGPVLTLLNDTSHLNLLY